ncbi:hypothetical protein E2C01_074989 [Portunus trituberculatus]|uniref:Uncharacterized protein n=1 Tax=Portunus trituberculatus TaxID=210409 RepID=A0A5B7I7B1_PORTR|nr:hypothetical protein [Portunus trituberculatus]
MEATKRKIAWQGQGISSQVEGREDQGRVGKCEVGMGRRESEAEGEAGRYPAQLRISESYTEFLHKIRDGLIANIPYKTIES